MSARLSADDMRRAHLSQSDVDEYAAYVAEHGDPLHPNENHNERNTMSAKYAIDSNYKQFDEQTGLPAYPRSTASTEAKLRNVQTALNATVDRVEAALDRALEEFEQALDREDRKRSTQQRLADMTRRNRRIN